MATNTTSNSINVTVVPAPSIASVISSPVQAVANQSVTFTINGTNFDPTSAVVQFTGTGCSPCTISALTACSLAPRYDVGYSFPMEPAGHTDVTRLLRDWKRGDRAAIDADAALVPLVVSELRRLAGGYMRGERPGHTLQPTALVDEAWLRLVQQDQAQFEDRCHFVAIAALHMRQILVEHARKRNAGKRGAGPRAVAFNDAQLLHARAFNRYNRSRWPHRTGAAGSGGAP